MIFRRLARQSGDPKASGVRPAFQIFLELQNNPQPPCAIILQPDHSRLAGEIAQHLRPDMFGNLPAEVLDAIRDHDCGWERSDQSQLENAQLSHAQPLRPFPQLSPEETHPSWRESIRRACHSSPLKGAIVSRHFCALASQVPVHLPFAEEENPRRERTERDLNIPHRDLDRWTAAIGFCDLVSLYLCSGAQEPAEFPLAHPSLPHARQAPKVVLAWIDGWPRFTSPIVEAGATVHVKSWEQRGESPGFHPKELEWRFLL